MKVMNNIEIIKFKNINKCYQKNVKALSEISFSVFDSEIFCLIGANGAGKSTLIKLLLNQINCTIGKIFVKGHNVVYPTKEIKIGYVPENFNLPEYYYAKDLLKFFGTLNNISKEKLNSRINEVLGIVNLDDINDKIKHFSKGMKKRLCIAQALISDFDILILDEPTDGLDPIERNRFLNSLLEFKNKGKTIFLATHNLEEIQEYFDRYAIIEKGSIIDVGNKRSIAKLEVSLKDYYINLIQQHRENSV